MRFIWKDKKLDLLPLRFCYKFMQTYTCVKEMNLAHFFKKDILPDVWLTKYM